MSRRLVWLFLALLFPLDALASVHPEWEVSKKGALTIRSRERPDSERREVWAEGPMTADVLDIQDVVMDGASHFKFMPHVEESRPVGEPEADGARYLYVRLDLPWVSARDYVSKTWLVEDAAKTGTFKNKWVAVPDKVPQRKKTVRITLNEGSWEVKSQGPGKSWASVRFTVDPGGSIPSFAADFGSTSGVPDMFKAVEKEARKRGEGRKEAPVNAAP